VVYILILPGKKFSCAFENPLTQYAMVRLIHIIGDRSAQTHGAGRRNIKTSFAIKYSRAGSPSAKSLIEDESAGMDLFSDA
jgi:hypothetical protein